MKVSAHTFFWWHHLDEDVVKEDAQCCVGQQAARSHKKEAIHHWVYRSMPFETVHIDFTEYKRPTIPFDQIHLLQMVWCACMGTSMTTSHTIDILPSQFCQFCRLPFTSWCLTTVLNSHHKNLLFSESGSGACWRTSISDRRRNWHCCTVSCRRLLAAVRDK